MYIAKGGKEAKEQGWTQAEGERTNDTINRKMLVLQLSPSLRYCIVCMYVCALVCHTCSIPERAPLSSLKALGWLSLCVSVSVSLSLSVSLFFKAQAASRKQASWGADESPRAPCRKAPRQGLRPLVGVGECRALGFRTGRLRTDGRLVHL